MKKIILLSVALLFSIMINAQKKDWAQLGRYTYQNAQLKSVPDVVFMGNSITDCWVDTVPEFFAKNNYVGRGISGQTSSQMLVRFQQDVISLRPKVVVILAGTNDIAENNGTFSNEGIMNNIVSMCELAKCHDITPVLCSLIPCAQFHWRKDLYPAGRIMQMNKMIKDYAERHGYEYVDYHSHMTTQNGGLIKNLSYDGVHPNMAGYKIMMPVVKSAIDKVIK